jgi:glutamate 5-kinase
MKILVKIGSALISRGNKIEYSFLKQKIEEIAQLQQQGHRVVVVSSGAVAAGMEIRGLEQRPTDMLQLQMLSGMGQVKLIKYYKELIQAKGLYTAQVLVTHHNFSTEGEKQTLKAVLDAYLQEGIIPVINENDLVDKEELEGNGAFSDNDILAALVASQLEVDLAIILTDVDGFFHDNPKVNKDAEFHHEISNVTSELFEMATNGKSDLGLGGMHSKIKAAKMVTESGIDTIVGNGNYSIVDLIEGNVRRTLFKSK